MHAEGKPMSTQTMYKSDPETSERAKRRADAIEMLHHAAWQIVAYLRRINDNAAADKVQKAIIDGELHR